MVDKQTAIAVAGIRNTSQFDVNCLQENIVLKTDFKDVMTHIVFTDEKDPL